MAVFPEIPVESLREPPSQFIQCVLHCSPILDFFQKKEQRFFYDNAAVAQLIFFVQSWTCSNRSSGNSIENFIRPYFLTLFDTIIKKSIVKGK